MADYKELLSKAIKALPENNGNARRKVYEKARAALVEQLRSIEPPLPAKEITKHRLELEDCIREVEQEATEILLARIREEQREKEKQAEILAQKQREEAEKALNEPIEQAEVLDDPVLQHIEDEADSKPSEGEVEKETEIEQPTHLEKEGKLHEESELQKEQQEDNSLEGDNLPQAEQAEKSQPEDEIEEVAKLKKENIEEAELKKISEPLEEERQNKEEGQNKEDAEEEEDEQPSMTDLGFIRPEGEADNLKLISGIGPKLEKRLNKLGIIKFSQISSLTEQDIKKLDEALYFKGRIERENWVEQAKKLNQDNLADDADDNDKKNAQTEHHDDKSVNIDAKDKDEDSFPKTIPLKSEEEEINSINEIIAQAKSANNKLDEKIKKNISQSSEVEPVIDTPKPDNKTEEKEEINYYPDDFPLPDDYEQSQSDKDAKETKEQTKEVSQEVDDRIKDNDPQATFDIALEKLDRVARGEDIDDSSINNINIDEKNIEKENLLISEKSTHGGGLKIFLIIFLIILLLAMGGGYWAWREGYVDVEALFGAQVKPAEQEIADSTTGANVTNNVTQNNDNIAVTPTPQNTVATTDPLDSVEEQVDSTENNPPSFETNEENQDKQIENNENEPLAAANNEITKIEDRLVSEEIGVDEKATEKEAEQIAEPNNPENNNVTNVTGQESSPPIAGTGAQSLLLEADPNRAGSAIPFSGLVEWSRSVDELGSPTIIAKANIPARNLGVELLIRRNSDASLPASHLMEINFIATETFAGGSIEGLPGILLKNEELVQGTPLVGASARIVSNSFLFALSADEKDIATNINMLENLKWIDLAIVYADGNRAIITLEKDEKGQRIFREVIQAWRENSVSTQ